MSRGKRARLDEKSIVNKYISGISISSIAKEYSTSFYRVRDVLSNCGVQIRDGFLSKRKYGVDDSYFSTIDCEEKAYWLGFIATDGCINATPCHRHRIILDISQDDKGHLYKFKKHLSSESRVLFNNARNTCSIAINSSRIKEDLAKNNIVPRKTLGITPPNVGKYNRHFWRGCIDGDGWICKYEKQGIWCLGFCGSKDMVSGFEDFVFKALGVRKRNHSEKDNIYYVKYYSADAYKIASLLYDKSVVYLDRKMELYNNLKGDML